MSAVTLVDHFTFDDQTLANTGSAGGTGTAAGSTTYFSAPSWGGAGYSFQNNGGNSSYFKITSAIMPGISFDTGFSIGFQVNLQATTGNWFDYFQINKGSSADSIRLENYGDNTKPITTFAAGTDLQSFTGGGTGGATGIILNEINTWHHVGITYENTGTQGAFNFWFDGALVGTLNGNQLTGNVSEIWVGKGNNNSSMNAVYDDVAVYDGVLTSTQMAQIALNGAASIIPEPSTYALFAGVVALGVAVVVRRRKSR